MAEMQTQTVQITASAAKELKSIRVKDQIPADKYLRVGVKGGGCSGLSYILEFEEKTDKDEIFTLEGVEVIVDPKHALYLAGIEVDFENGLNDRGFVFNNPNAKSTCGCGTSFST